MKNLKETGVSGLRFLERYTKTDMVYLAKGGSWLLFGQFVSSGAAFLTSIAFANLLLPETFGVYKYVLSISSLLTISTLSGMDSAVTQAVARGFEGTLLPAVREKMKWGVLGSGGSLVVAIYYFVQGNPTLAISFCVVALFMPFSESFDMYNSLLLGKKLFNIQTYYNSIKKIIAVIAVVTTIFLTHNLFVILFVYFASVVVPNIFFLRRTITLHKENYSVDPEALGYGKHLSVIYIITLVLAELDKILLFHFVGATNLAVYALAVAPNDQIKGLLKNVNSLAMPHFSQSTPDKIRENIWGKIKLLAIGICATVVGYILLAPYFFTLFFPKYLESVFYSQILAISLVPVVLAGFLYTVLESQKAKKELYQYNIYSNIFGLIILVPLIYYFGIWGAIISRMSTRLFSFGLISNLIRNVS